jgi:hypothetical protein
LLHEWSHQPSANQLTIGHPDDKQCWQLIDEHTVECSSAGWSVVSAGWSVATVHHIVIDDTFMDESAPLGPPYPSNVNCVAFTSWTESIACMLRALAAVAVMMPPIVYATLTLRCWRRVVSVT